MAEVSQAGESGAAGSDNLWQSGDVAAIPQYCHTIQGPMGAAAARRTTFQYLNSAMYHVVALFENSGAYRVIDDQEHVT